MQTWRTGRWEAKPRKKSTRTGKKAKRRRSCINNTGHSWLLISVGIVQSPWNESLGTEEVGGYFSITSLNLAISSVTFLITRQLFSTFLLLLSGSSREQITPKPCRCEKCTAIGYASWLPPFPRCLLPPLRCSFLAVSLVTCIMESCYIIIQLIYY